MKNLVILISGRGSNMEAIVRACANEAWPARIAAVIANRPDAAGLAFAASHGIATGVVDHRQYPDRASFDTALAQAIDNHAPDLVVLAGFMRVLTEGFVQRYSGRMLNIHPSLLPSFPGLKTHEKAIEAGCRVHGATVHFVTPTLDHGPIVMQSAVPVRTGDDAAALAARVLATEHVIYPRAVRWFVEGRLALDGERVTLTPPEAQWLFVDEASVEENAKTGAQAVKAGASTHAGEGA
ncbi:phosphoribosylglycinamide formyltransferase [Paraburkholderia sacchari]|uniref:Phosphoribosylglycinamide formyltransferase n=1 Tax=Paraburkholderia sacchari TaxID=159450 RepID=A0A8T6ZC19_9BURK|nr:phosphoribosylglycinamide formyltransferase [Paraburkholderia sacchari]NLP62225.1 phosphoribosylglycinamide formyltransferase [Paraburkholderia sacchari]